MAKEIPFIKIQEGGKSYHFVQSPPDAPLRDPASLSKGICHPTSGQGGDGVVLVHASAKADARLQMFRPDGTEQHSRGHGLAGAGKFLYEQGLARRPQLRVEWDDEVLFLDLQLVKDKVARVRVDLGKPIFESGRIPTTLPGNPPVDVPLTWPNTVYNVTCLSLGEPHCVVFVRDLPEDLVRAVGSQMERHPGFPQGTNVEFAKVSRPDDVTLRVWERGIGEAVMSGPGACAVTVAGALTGRTARRLKAHLPGGEVEAEWVDASQHVCFTIPVDEVAQGRWKIEK